MLFEQLSLIEPILKALEHEGYTQPTPIQSKAIPNILQGRDLLGCAQTGTGKTAAFAIPMIQLLMAKKSQQPGYKGIKALILTPTRELAIQIKESFKAYGRFTPLRHTVIFGGVSQEKQVQELRRGIDILVATPGRLLDLMQQKIVSLKDIEFLVLDEADRMLDMGFVHDVKRIITNVPAQRQTLFFSATMAQEIRSLANTMLRDPAYVEVTPVSSTAEKVEQSIYHVDKIKKQDLLVHLLESPEIDQALVFTRTKHGADKVVKGLNKAGITAEAIHGNKSQNARQRALGNFKDKTTRILVATDIAARGIDFEQLTHVFNFDLPNIPETYVHRIGRTGRAGYSGIALSFCDREERPFLRDIEKTTKLSIPVVQEHPYLPQPGEQPAIARPLQPNQGRNPYRSGNKPSGNKQAARPGGHFHSERKTKNYDKHSN
ncbi:DEAD/DEAH box helicase [Flavihumibacter rivuli]|uniref:DEAD/DEAH box helicase n=1 Tax=Flavihumibacter rivuli TaxID=2838156 RepID=UPI001BDE1A90|nr:DEAD/DEAH box helicase [Flavihumibacter rivuli]ULQ57183.1 DEAD/DEAH box helicase [Flavihumibacter rivuli]